MLIFTTLRQAESAVRPFQHGTCLVLILAPANEWRGEQIQRWSIPSFSHIPPAFCGVTEVK